MCERAIYTCQCVDVHVCVCISLQVGVLQGDPFSVAIFNTVNNLLLDHIKHACPNTGYRFTSSNKQVSTLLMIHATLPAIVKSTKRCLAPLKLGYNGHRWSLKFQNAVHCPFGADALNTIASQPPNSLFEKNKSLLGDETIPFLGMPVTD